MTWTYVGLTMHYKSVTGAINNAAAGWYSVPGPFTAPVIFFNDIKRTDEQKGIFGEVNVDVSDTWSLQ